MKAMVVLLGVLVATPALAQTAAASSAPAAMPAPAAAKYTLDTPIVQLVADPQAKAVLDADLPGLTTHEAFEMFKSMSLNEVVPMSQGKMTPEALAKTQADLAKIK